MCAHIYTQAYILNNFINLVQFGFQSPKLKIDRIISVGSVLLIWDSFDQLFDIKLIKEENFVSPK